MWLCYRVIQQCCLDYLSALNKSVLWVLNLPRFLNFPPAYTDVFPYVERIEGNHLLQCLSNYQSKAIAIQGGLDNI